MNQSAILASIASLKKQITALESLVAGAAKIVPSEDEGEKQKKQRKISPERLAYLKSPEHAAKLKAGLDAYRAKKAAEKAAPVELPESPIERINSSSSVSGESTDGTQKKRRGPKKISEMTPEELEAHKAKVAERKAKKAAEKVE
jgi:hypothetical protein